MKPPAGSWPVVAGVALVAAGVAGPLAQPAARVALVAAVVLTVAAVIVTRPARFLGGLAAVIWVTDARADWRAIRVTAGVVLAVAAVALAPPVVWRCTLLAGCGVLAGVAARRWMRPARIPRVPTLPDLSVPDWWHSSVFRRRYRRVVAPELGWDKDRRGGRDRRQVPGLADARLRDGVWTVVLVSRGDWGPDRWEREAHALKRFLGGRSVRWRMDGLRVVLTVHTRDLPAPGEVTVTEPPRVSEHGLLVGHDAARRPVHWAADDSAPHMLAVGATGGGKSTLASLLLVQAAASQGWDAVMLDCKETRAWEWLRGWGVTVIRQRPDIHTYLRGLEVERRRIEDAGGDGVRRLVVIDEARLVLGTHAGPDRDDRRETIGVVGDLTSLGRSAGFRLLPVIQRPDVEHVGGGFLRDNLPARVALGRLEPDGATMVFAGRTTTPEELGVLDGTPGRALVSGLRGGDPDVWPIQVPRLALPRRDVPATDATEAPTGLAGRVLGEVPEAGPVARADVARRLGVGHRDVALRRAVAGLLEAGLVEESRDERGRVVLRRPGAGGGAAAGAGGGHPPKGGVPTGPSGVPPGGGHAQPTLPGVTAAA